MDENFGQLRNITKVEPPAQLKTRIREAVEKLQPKQVPLQWSLAVAATFILFVCAEAFVLLKHTETSQAGSISLLLNNQQNTLYDE